MIDIFVQTKSGIQITNGYKIQNGLVAHKSLSDPKSWNVSDYNSGLCVKNGLKTLNECVIYGKSFVDKAKVEKVKKGERYERYVKSLKEWKEKYLGSGNN